MILRYSYLVATHLVQSKFCPNVLSTFTALTLDLEKIERILIFSSENTSISKMLKNYNDLSNSSVVIRLELLEQNFWGLNVLGLSCMHVTMSV